MGADGAGLEGIKEGMVRAKELGVDEKELVGLKGFLEGAKGMLTAGGQDRHVCMCHDLVTEETSVTSPSVPMNQVPSISQKHHSFESKITLLWINENNSRELRHLEQEPRDVRC